jgi:hypothetical protein
VTLKHTDLPTKHVALYAQGQAALKLMSEAVVCGGKAERQNRLVSRLSATRYEARKRKRDDSEERAHDA